jgi:lipopolysaccharide export system protein LptA
VRAHRRSAKDNANFTAPQAVLAMEPRDNLLRSVTASGGVHVDMRSGTDTPAGPQSRTLDTAALRLDFHSISDPDPRSQISAAETLAPGVIGLDSPGENTQVHAAKFNAHFDAAGRFDWLEGHSGTEINRQIKSDPPQKITARDLTVTFANDGGWSNLKLDRNVRFHQADRTAECDRATIAHATNLIHLDGSPAVADATTRTTADAIEISQSTNDIHAESSVITTYRNSTPDKAPDIGAGIAHISSDTLAGNGASGHLIYSGHARYWQGDTALNADVIEITRAQNRIDAHGNVVAALPQLPGPGLQGTSPGNKPTRPVIWDVRAPVLHYWNDTGKGLLEGGVNATSTQGALHSETLDLFLAPANQTAPAAQPQAASQPGPADQPPKSKGAPASATPKPAPAVATQGRQLERAVAQGSVVVQQGERRGMADQGVYTASDGRYVLSGGDPTIVDAGSDTTTQGHSLTFYVASDTILIDAQAGSKTLTKHRVEK